MVKLIIGGTGSGKTKELIDQVNAAVKEEKGSVVCISRGDKLTFGGFGRRYCRHTVLSAWAASPFKTAGLSYGGTEITPFSITA